jgi:sugar phosphate isomerase/epimerase
MKFGHQTNSRGVVGHPVGVTSVKDLFYLANGDMGEVIREIAGAGYEGIEMFDGNLLEYPGGAAGGSDLPELIRRYEGRITYVHLKDYVADPFGFVPLGEGGLAFEPIARALQDIGYDGWTTVETDGYAGDPRTSADISRRFLRTLFPGGRS